MAARMSSPVRPCSARWSRSSISRSMSLDEQEVAHQHLVDERRDEIAGGQVAEARLAVEAVDGTAAERPLALVDGQHDVATREEVDLATDQAWWCGVIGLHRLERDVEQLSGVGEPRAAVVVSQPLDVGIGQPSVSSVWVSVVLFLIARIDIDPQESLRPERAERPHRSARRDGHGHPRRTGGRWRCSVQRAQAGRGRDGDEGDDVLQREHRSVIGRFDLPGPARSGGAIEEHRYRTSLRRDDQRPPASCGRHHAPGSAFGA